LNWSINRNASFDDQLGTVEPTDILVNELSVTGSLELNLIDDTSATSCWLTPTKRPK
jgi:hypothetical protein